jgi:hypothetical protein
LEKNETVSGMAGNTHGVASAASPARNAVMRNSHTVVAPLPPSPAPAAATTVAGALGVGPLAAPRSDSATPASVMAGAPTLEGPHRERQGHTLPLREARGLRADLAADLDGAAHDTRGRCRVHREHALEAQRLATVVLLELSIEAAIMDAVRRRSVPAPRWA